MGSVAKTSDHQLSLRTGIKTVKEWTIRFAPLFAGKLEAKRKGKPRNFGI